MGEGPIHQRRLALALAITALYCAVELVGGWLTNSLALLSDAGHMFADVGALGISFAAARIAQRPPTARKTFGYHRVEILAAFVNGLALWLVVGLILHAAWERLFAQPAVRSQGLIAIAAVGLGVNLAVLGILHRAPANSLNVRAALAHVAGDALGSLAAILAGVTMLTTGWYGADPLVSVAIAGLILHSSWGIVRESVDILMQGTPRDVRLDAVEQCLLEIDGVCQVHDLHVWTLTSGRHTLSVHLVVRGGLPPPALIATAQDRLLRRFGIDHSTVQVDHEAECAPEYRAH